MDRRSRRPDSKQMWEESEQRAPAPRPPRDERRGGDERNYDSRYRSRSPRDGGRGPRRDERSDRRDDRSGRREPTRDDRGSRREPARDERTDRRDPGRDDRGKRWREDDRSGYRERDGERGTHTSDMSKLCYRHKPDILRESGRPYPRESRDRRRSRSPRRERKREWEKEKEAVTSREVKQSVEEAHRPKALVAEEEFTRQSSRTATPPVFAFGLGENENVHDHDRMDTGGDATAKVKGKRGKKDKPKVEQPDEDDIEIVVEDDGMAAMQAMMGFGGFNTTQHKQVLGNDIGAVRKEKKTEYRQYMNRAGGFNRPLSPSRD